MRKYPEKESYLFDVLRHGLPTIENTPSNYQDLTFEKLLMNFAKTQLWLKVRFDGSILWVKTTLLKK